MNRDAKTHAQAIQEMLERHRREGRLRPGVASAKRPAPKPDSPEALPKNR